MPAAVWLHSKVWLAWGAWWAVQVYRAGYVSLGFHLDWRRPLLLDLHLGWVIIALGRRAGTTLPVDRQRRSCRGFWLGDQPVL